eukprot:1213980-Pyramimonas_sp.AAC.1
MEEADRQHEARIQQTQHAPQAVEQDHDFTKEMSSITEEINQGQAPLHPQAQDETAGNSSRDLVEELE